jgi:hypothetical protein
MKRFLTLLPLLALSLTACGDKDGGCETEGEYQCDGTMLQICDADLAWADDTECSDVGMECHAEMGHCMDMGDDSGSMEM